MLAQNKGFTCKETQDISWVHIYVYKMYNFTEKTKK